MNGTSTPLAPPKDPFRDLRWVSSTLSALALAMLIVTSWYGVVLVGWRFQPQLLWAIALWSAGVGLGFLFGIPRVLQGKAPAPAPAPAQGGKAAAGAAAVVAAYEQRVNTNLEEISDWLTKIIVGITLVQLNQFPPLLTRLSRQIVADLPGTATGYGIALIVTFSVLGFLFGYLVTRLYLQGALARAERGLSEEGRLELQTRAITAETTVELLTDSRTAAAPAPQTPGPPQAGVLQRLDELSQEYVGANIGDWRARTDQKNRIAKALGEVVLSNGVSRDWLARQTGEPLVLALASAVQARPEAGDAERLLKAASGVTRKHVRYRVAMAFSRLISSGLLPSSVAADVRRLLQSYLKDADPPLVEMVQGVLNQMGAVSS